jgi:hypothetical protein
MQWNGQRMLTSSVVVAAVAAAVFVAPRVRASGPAAANETAQVTFAKDIAPILQQKCQACHRPGGGAAMSLISYQEVRPWAKAIKQRTGLGSRPDVMPPWFIDKTIGIQKYKADMSLNDDQIAKIAKWVDAGSPEGNPGDAPPPLKFANGEWQLGKPDMIISSPQFDEPRVAPDWYGPLGVVPTGLTEDRYVASIEAREITDFVESQGDGASRQTVGGQVIFHHLVYTVVGPKGEVDDSPWPIHEVARNVDVLDPEAGLLLKAGSKISFTSAHMHANGRRTKAHVEFGFKFHPKGYQPTKRLLSLRAATRDLDIRGNLADQKFEAFMVLKENAKIMIFEPHMHAAGVRMCLDAIFGTTTETLSCAGYNHSWVRVYTYEDDFAPLLPKGTIMRVTSYFDNSPSNKNVADPRNWIGSGQRSLDNMSIGILTTMYLSDEAFKKEVATRRQHLKLTAGQSAIGCPTCGFDEEKYAGAARQRPMLSPVE